VSERRLTKAQRKAQAQALREEIRRRAARRRKVRFLAVVSVVVVAAVGTALALLLPSHSLPGLQTGPGPPPRSGRSSLDGLAGHSESTCDLGDLPPVLHHREQRLVPLLHDRQLHQHRPTSSSLDEGARPREKPGTTTVKDQPEPPVKDQAEQVSTISRSRVQDQVTPECRASPEVRQRVVPRGGVRPDLRDW
jgi:hypothetical protein